MKFRKEQERMIAKIFFGWYEKPDIREFFPVQPFDELKHEYPLDLLNEKDQNDKNN